MKGRKVLGRNRKGKRTTRGANSRILQGCRKYTFTHTHTHIHTYSHTYTHTGFGAIDVLTHQISRGVQEPAPTQNSLSFPVPSPVPYFDPFSPLSYQMVLCPNLLTHPHPHPLPSLCSLLYSPLFYQFHHHYSLLSL